MLLKSIARNLSREDWIIPAILYANVGMFVLSLLIHPQKTGFSLNPLTFLSPDNWEPDPSGRHRHDSDPSFRSAGGR